MDKQQSNSEIKEQISYEQIENTPFTLCRKDEVYCLLIGNTQVTNWGTEEDARIQTSIRNTDWNTLTTIIVTMIEKFQEIQEIKKNKRLILKYKHNGQTTIKF